MVDSLSVIVLVGCGLKADGCRLLSQIEQIELR